MNAPDPNQPNLMLMDLEYQMFIPVLLYIPPQSLHHSPNLEIRQSAFSWATVFHRQSYRAIDKFLSFPTLQGCDEEHEGVFWRHGAATAANERREAGAVYGVDYGAGESKAAKGEVPNDLEKTGI